MARTAALPALKAESGLSQYLDEIRRFPMLEPQEEYMLARSWREHGDREAAHRLVTSHLRLVAKIAMGYRGYGLPISEVVSEGNVGLMQAVKRFEPEKGFRLATYAMWWIKAAIQEYILRSWSLVKMGTTANQKKLFFNLRKAKSKISALEEGDLRPDHAGAAGRVGDDPAQRPARPGLLRQGGRCQRGGEQRAAAHQAISAARRRLAIIDIRVSSACASAGSAAVAAMRAAESGLVLGLALRGSACWRWSGSAPLNGHPRRCRS